MRFESAPLNLNVSDSKLISDIEARIESQAALRREREGKWALSWAFYTNHQWVALSGVTNTLFTPPNPQNRKRLSLNLIHTYVRKGAARMLARIPQWLPAPHHPSYNDKEASRLAVDVLRAKWHELNVLYYISRAAQWLKIAGPGIVEINWDKLAGPAIAQVITDPVTGEQIVARDAKGEPMVHHQGDIRIDEVTPWELFVDPNCRRPDLSDAAWVARKRIRSLAWVRQYFPAAQVNADEGADMKTSAERIMGDAGISIPQAVSTTEGQESQIVEVTDYYEQPNPKNSKGLHVVKTRTGVLHRGENVPWEVTESYPFRICVDVENLLGFWPYSTTEFAIETQVEINKTISQLAENKNLAVIGKLLYPKGSLGENAFDAGLNLEKVPYLPMGGMKPELLKLSFVPVEALEYLKLRKQDIQDIYGFRDVSMGITAKREQSGYAIQQLAEQDAEQQGLVFQRFLEMVRNIGRDILKWVAYAYGEERVIGYTDEDKRSVQVTLKSGKQIAEATDVDLDIVGHQQFGQAAYMQQVIDAVKVGALKPDMFPEDRRLVRRVLGMMQPVNVFEGEEIQERLTGWEIQQMDQGVAVTSALPIEDHVLAMEQHRKHMLNPDFKVRTPDDPIRVLHLMHFQTHIEVGEEGMALGVAMPPLAPQTPPQQPNQPPPNFTPPTPARAGIPAPQPTRGPGGQMMTK